MFFDRLAVLALAVALALMGPCGVVPSGTGHVPTAAAAGRSFWVSPDGRDSNPGTQALPFETIQRAWMPPAPQTLWTADTGLGVGTSSAVPFSSRTPTTTSRRAAREWMRERRTARPRQRWTM